MNKYLLILVFLLGCKDENQHLTQGDKKLLNPPIFITQKTGTCESIDLNILLEKGCSKEKIESLILKNKSEIFKPKNYTDPFEVAVLKDNLEFFQFLERSNLLDLLDFNKAFSVAIKEEKYRFVEYFLRIKPLLYFDLFTELNFEKLKTIEFLLKNNKMSSSLVVHSLEDETYFPLRWMAESSPKKLSFQGQEILKEIIRILMGEQADLEFKTKQKRNLLHLSALFDNPLLSKELIRRNPALVREQDFFGYTPLHLSVLKYSLEVFDTLRPYLKEDDYLVDNFYKENPLVLAIRIETPLLFKEMISQVELETLLKFENLVGKNLLILSSEHARAFMVHALLTKGYPLDRKDRFGRDANYFAAYGLKKYPLKKNYYKTIIKLIKMSQEGSLSDEWTSDLLEK